MKPLYKQDIKNEAIEMAYDEDIEYVVSDVVSPKYSGNIYIKPKKFSFSKNNMEVSYVKLIVENYDVAKKMGIAGIEQNDRLVSGVTVRTKEFGIITFSGRDSREIIAALETPRILSLQILSKQLGR